jgi:hypothetical protein
MDGAPMDLDRHRRIYSDAIPPTTTKGSTTNGKLEY